MDYEFEKVVAIGDYTIGVIYDEDDNAYYIVDDEIGRIFGSNDYFETIERFQLIVCEELNDYFADVYEDEDVILS